MAIDNRVDPFRANMSDYIPAVPKPPILPSPPPPPTPLLARLKQAKIEAYVGRDVSNPTPPVKGMAYKMIVHVSAYEGSMETREGPP